jgi:hypothetical protein
MIASLVWKEYREHRSVWLTMTLLAVVSLSTAVAVLMPQGLHGSSEDHIAGVVGAALILTAMYGLVCGAMMLAGERETRGMPFLEALPLSRTALWWMKLLIGIAFVLIYSAMVAAVGPALGVVGPQAIPAPWLLLLPLVGLEAFAWGLCASTFCRTVLTAVALAALLPLPVLWLVSGVFVAQFMQATPNALDAALLVAAGHTFATLLALGVSLMTFAERDFEKRFALRPARSSYGQVAPKRQPDRYQVLLWLAVRQKGVALAGALCLLGFAVGLGLPVAGVGLWPVATLCLGVACGMAVFVGEQADGVFKFWGDQRLPVGWLWLRRTLLWAGVCTVGSGLMLLGALVAAGSQGNMPTEPVALFERLLGAPAGALGPGVPLLFLMTWPAHGFALGQVCALVWRKSAVALVVAVISASGVAALWVPSLLGGGLGVLAVLGVPLLLLGACRLALWDWVTDRLRTSRAVGRMVGGVALGCVWLAACFGLRVVEVPSDAEPFDWRALQRRLADPEVGRPGQKIRDAMLLFNGREQPRLANNQAGPRVMGVGIGVGGRAESALSRERLGRVLEAGWGAADPEMQKRLDTLTADPWAALLAEGAKQPPGMFIHPVDVSDTSRKDAADCRRSAMLLTVRALRVQETGADEAALDHLLTALALSRHLRYQAPAYSYMEGLEAERAALSGLGRWLGRAGRHPKLLARALDGLGRHESEMPAITEVLGAEYFRYCWALEQGSIGESNVSAILMQTPWEAERAHRLGRAVFAGRLRLAEAGTIVPPADGEDEVLVDYRSDPAGPSHERLGGLLRSSWLASSLPVTAPAQRGAQLGLCRVRATRLLVALAIYQRQHGQAAPSLADLVPGVLPELPDDPYTGQPFRYRVSQGERLTWHSQLAGGGEEFVRDVPEGQGIVWSAGPDGRDDGGTRQWDGDAGADAGRDLLFLVPRVAGP